MASALFLYNWDFASLNFISLNDMDSLLRLYADYPDAEEMKGKEEDQKLVPFS